MTFLRTPSFVLLLVVRLLLALGDWLPILRALRCILIELPAIIGLGMAAAQWGHLG